MSRADAVAFEYAKENGTLGLDYNQIYDAVKYGYYQAERDLKLTWKDIDIIYNLLCEEFNYQLECGKRLQKDACQEVLKRFQDYKERNK